MGFGTQFLDVDLVSWSLFLDEEVLGIQAEPSFRLVDDKSDWICLARILRIDIEGISAVWASPPTSSSAWA